MTAPIQATPSTSRITGSKISNTSEVKPGLVYKADRYYAQLQSDGSLFYSESNPPTKNNSVTYTGEPAKVFLQTLITGGLYSTTTSTGSSSCSDSIKVDREAATKARSEFYTRRLDPLVNKNIACAQRLSNVLKESVRVAANTTSTDGDNTKNRVTLNILKKNSRALKSHLKAIKDEKRGTQAYYKQVAEMANFINQAFSLGVYTGVPRDNLRDLLNNGPVTNRRPSDSINNIAPDDRDCLLVAQCYLNAWQDLPKIPSCPPPEVSQPKPKPPQKPAVPICPEVEAEKWGVRFKYSDNSNQGNCVASRSFSTTDNSGNSLPFIREDKEWFLTLLPAMRSILPIQGGMDTPNAMPGLQFRVMSNIAKHRVPGFQPIYQNLGVEALYITLVGTFTGDGGLGKVTRLAGINSNGLTVGSQVAQQGPVFQSSRNDNQGAILSNGNNVKGGNTYLLKQGTGQFYIQYSNDLKSYRSASQIEELSSTSYLPIPSLNAQAEINNSIQNGAIYYEINPNNISNNSSGVNLDTSSLSTLTAIGQASPVTTYNLHNEFLADGCPGECPKPGIDKLEKGHWNSTKESSPVNSGTFKPLYEIASKLDSYHEFVSFYKLSMQQGHELEVEINLRKNKDGMYPTQGLDDDPLRDGKTGNPKFKGYVRRLEVYQARSDRTWYMIELEVTDHGLVGKKAINLTDDITARANVALASQEAAAALIDGGQKKAQCLYDTGKVWCKDISRLDTGASRKFCYSEITGEGFYMRDEIAEDRIYTPLQTAAILADAPRNWFSGLLRWEINDVSRYLNGSWVSIKPIGSKPTERDIKSKSVSELGLTLIEATDVGAGLGDNTFQVNNRKYFHPSGYGVILQTSSIALDILTNATVTILEPIQTVNYILGGSEALTLGLGAPLGSAALLLSLYGVNKGNIDDIKTYLSSGTIKIESANTDPCIPTNPATTTSATSPTPGESTSPANSRRPANAQLEGAVLGGIADALPSPITDALSQLGSRLFNP
jgi:hypothetical protein